MRTSGLKPLVTFAMALAGVLFAIPFAFILLFAATHGGDSLFGCNKVESREKAIAISKERSLRPNSMREIVDKGGDASLFEHSVEGDFGSPCNRPERFHTYRVQSPGKGSEEHQVYWSRILKGACPECWDIITVMTGVSRCGNLSFFMVSRRPNEDLALVPENQRTKGENILRHVGYCGPRGIKPQP